MQWKSTTNKWHQLTLWAHSLTGPYFELASVEKCVVRDKSIALSIRTTWFKCIISFNIRIPEALPIPFCCWESSLERLSKEPKATDAAFDRVEVHAPNWHRNLCSPSLKAWGSGTGGVRTYVNAWEDTHFEANRQHLVEWEKVSFLLKWTLNLSNEHILEKFCRNRVLVTWMFLYCQGIFIRKLILIHSVFPHWTSTNKHLNFLG